MVFEHLSEEQAEKLYKEFIAQGFDKDTVFNEVYSIDCNMDEED